MKLEIEIDLENDAFQDDNNARECARILREWCEKFEGTTLDRYDTWTLRDINGHTVGHVWIAEN